MRADAEAERRIDQAYRLIESALRLGMDPVEAARRIKPAFDAGIERYAADMVEDVAAEFRR
jgi:hypothetical protein